MLNQIENTQNHRKVKRSHGIHCLITILFYEGGIWINFVTIFLHATFMAHETFLALQFEVRDLSYFEDIIS